MIKRILFTLLFLVIWLPCLLFTSTNATTSAPLPPKESFGASFDWRYKDRSVDFSTLPPTMLIAGAFKTVTGQDGPAFTLQADFIEWLYSGRSARHKVKKGPVFITNIPARPHVSQWDIDHDKGMKYSIGGLRFNGIFLMGLFLSLLLPPLFMLWMLADDITIVTPQERKRRDDAFLELVKIIEAKAQHDPAWLQRKTMHLAFLGYVVVLGSIALMIPVGLGLGAAVLVMSGGNAAAAKLAFVLAAVPIGFACVMGKSLLSPKYLPPGLEVTQADAPKLFAWLDTIIQKAEGPRFQQVYISNEVNASVSRHTGWLGFFGFGPVTLTLGLPLMQLLTLPQLAGVIGHEYGHVAAKDNAKGQWIYRIRNSWLVLGDRLQLEHLWYALKLNRFYSWFIGVFSAYSFALSRRCEYEADAFSSKLAGAENAASALCAVAVHGEAIGAQYWRDVWKRAETQADHKSEAPYTSLAAWLKEERDLKEITEGVLKEKTGYGSTHPSTLDRVRALGRDFVPPAPVRESSAAALLGAFEHKLAQQFNAEWHEAAGQHWQASHEEHKHYRARHEELKQKPLESLTLDELRELSSAAIRLRDDAGLTTASGEILKREPENTAARLNIASLKLEAGDESQVAEIEAVMAKDAQLYPNGCQHISSFYHKAGRTEEAKPWDEKLSAWEYERAAAAEERELVLATDSYAPHGLPQEQVDKLAAHCAATNALHTVYLVKKQVKYMPEYPAYLIAFRLKSQPFRSQKKIQDDINNFIATSGLGGGFLFVEAGAVAGLEGKLKKIEGACISSPKMRKLAA